MTETDKEMSVASEIIPAQEVTPVGVPEQLITLAVQGDADVDKLEKLLQLKREHDADEARKEFVDAFILFQSLAPTLVKTANGHNSAYVPLGEIAAQIQPALEECGLSYRFHIEDCPTTNKLIVTTIVSHRAGHSERTTMSAEADDTGNKNAIQARGSAVTYLQRYTLIAALGLTTADKDQDGRLESVYVTDGQAASIKARLEHTKSNVQAFCHALNIPNVDAMPASKYAHADRMLTHKETTLATAGSAQ